MTIATMRKRDLGQKRAWRVRKKLHGTAARPRLSVHKSNAHIQAQLIDDDAGVTLGQAASFAKEVRGTDKGRKGKVSAKAIGEAIAKVAQAKGITEVIFDRGQFKYHGVLAELADAARSAGLKF